MDVAGLRDQFSVLQRKSWLFAGGLSPLADRVATAIYDTAAIQRNEPERLYEEVDRLRESARKAIANVLRVRSDQIALMDSTSRATTVAIRLLKMIYPQGEVIIDDSAFPSAIYPWLTDPNYTPVLTDSTSTGSTVEATDQILDRISDRTIAVVISHVCPVSGFKHDPSMIAKRLATRGVKLIVDGAQSIGYIPLSLQGDRVDIMVGTTSKWLLGTTGLGFLYVSDNVPIRGKDLDPGYMGLADQGWVWPRTYIPDRVSGLKRLEDGMPSITALAASIAGIELLEEVGIESVANIVTRNVQTVVNIAQEFNLHIVSSNPRNTLGGVVAIDTAKSMEIAKLGRQRGVILGGYPWGLLRIDPHAYCNETDFKRLVELFSSVFAPA